MSRLRPPAPLAVICTLLFAPTAAAQDINPLDPDSPAGVEYQLPLEQARKNLGGGRDAGEDRSGGNARTGAVPLFGAGIVALSADATGGDQGDSDGLAPGRASPERSSRSGEERRGDRKEAGSDDPVVSRSALSGADSHDGSATWRIAGVALAVLLAGGLLGLGLRRGLGQSGD